MYLGFVNVIAVRVALFLFQNGPTLKFDRSMRGFATRLGRGRPLGPSRQIIVDNSLCLLDRTEDSFVLQR